MPGAPTITSPSPSPSRSPTPKAAPKSEPGQPEMFLVEPQPNDVINAPSGSAPSEQPPSTAGGSVASFAESNTYTKLSSETTSASGSLLFSTGPVVMPRPKPEVPPRQPMYVGFVPSEA